MKEYYRGYQAALEKLGFDWAKGFNNLMHGPSAGFSKSMSSAAGNTVGRNASAGMSAAVGSISKATGAAAPVGKGLGTAGKAGG